MPFVLIFAMLAHGGLLRGLIVVDISRSPRERSLAAGLLRGAEMVVDQHGTVIEWSSEATDLLGHASSDVLGKPVASLLEADRSIGWGQRQSVASVVLRRRDGNPEACHIQIRPSRSPGCWTVQVVPVGGGPNAQVVDEAVLNALFTQSPASLCVYGADLRLQRFNPAAEGMQGVFGERSVGLMPHELWPDSNSLDFESGMRRVLATGVPLVNFEKRGRPPDDPEHEHIFANSVFRLEDPQGHVVGLATTAVEITQQRTVEERIRLLADASSVIGTSLDVVQTSQQLADVAVPRFADAATVDVFTSVISGEDLDPAQDELRRVGLRHTNASDETVNRPGRSRFPYPLAPEQQFDEPYRTDVQLLLESGEPLWSTGETQAAHSLVVPMKHRNILTGVVTFYRIGPRSTAFSDFDVFTARDLVSRATLSIDNARRYAREHKAARTLQRQLLPSRAVPQSAVETAHHFAPGASGASWFDVIPVSGARVALVVGTTDEAGLSGTAAVGRLGAAVHALADLDLSPDEVLARLDALVSRITGERDAGPSSADVNFKITCVYAVYDPANGRLSLASAGHALPIAVHPDSGAQNLSAPVGAPLGCADRESGTNDIDLPAGTTVVFYASALTTGGQAAEQPASSLIRTMTSSALAPLRQLRNRAVEALPDAWTSPAGTALLFARTQRLDEDHMSTWDLPSDPAVVATARSLVQRQLTVWGLEESAFVTELVVSELVTNAIRYAEGPIHMRVIRDHHALICEVSDATTTAPHLRYARSGDEGGRGLFLIAQLTRRWGTRFSGRGKTIWTEQDVEDEAAP
ncbi:SpoIIE family protein phosphatase [Streptomyces rubiginosohelvolus]|uniref:SpoIIE family protein phosphatase n=1 Tax=Streptomyces rubiginosohelvolus TaxID=67362 RepID=UPI00371010FA